MHIRSRSVRVTGHHCAARGDPGDLFGQVASRWRSKLLRLHAKLARVVVEVDYATS